MLSLVRLAPPAEPANSYDAGADADADIEPEVGPTVVAGEDKIRGRRVYLGDTEHEQGPR